MLINFTVPGVPVAQPRQRHTQINEHMHNYTPTKHPVNAFKAAVLLTAQQAYRGPALEGPITVYMDFYLPRPQRLLTKHSPEREILHTIKPDWENLAKSVCDALKGVLWRDDCQISDSIVRKRYCAKAQQAETVITVVLSDVS